MPSTESSRHPISITYMITTEATDTSWGGKQHNHSFKRKINKMEEGDIGLHRGAVLLARLLSRSKVRDGHRMSEDNSLSDPRTL